MARKRRVPEVLWRLFNNRARTLVDTILALIPPIPATAADCRCQGQRCLSCSGDQAMSFILRPEDPYDYRRLLTRCFVVVSPNAPPLLVFDPRRRWSQYEIVRRSIEMILSEQPSSSNLICWSYDNENQSSSIVDLLMSSAWVLLLTRVGDALMMYLLKYTSLFLPLPKNKHHQIIGFPISDLSLKFSRHIPDSKSQHNATAHGKRRKRVGRGESPSGEQLCACSFTFEHSSNSYRSVGIDGSVCVTEELSLKKPEGSSKPNIAPSRKRTRQYRWQRQRKRRLLPIHETCSLMMSCKRDLSNSDNMSRGLQNGFCTSSGQCDENNISHCFCCLVFQNLPKLTKNAEIDRRSIFYRMESSSSMLPKKHILYTMKPNESGATVLFKNIFGIRGIDENSQSMKCYHSKTSCFLRSSCLYHSLIQLLKSLIRKTQNCRYLRLLDKHCSMASFYEGTSKGTGAMYGENDTWANVPMSGCNGTQTEGAAFHGDNASNNKMVSEATYDQVEPIKSYCMKKQVVSFIWAICRSIVPLQLLGTPSNWRILRKNISEFIKLRKFEKFSLKQCMHKLKLSKFPLLSIKHFSWNLSFDEMKHTEGKCVHKHKGCIEFAITDIVRHTIFECWIFWFFARLVAPLVQANFYVTESEHEKQEVLYYRKSSWEKLMREARKCLKDQRYHQLNHASTRKILENRSFGFSKIRLCPKQKGFRVLANLQASSRMLMNTPPSRIQYNHYLQKKAFCSLRSIKYESFKSVNSILRDLHVVLKGIHSKEPHKLGSSVFDYNDVHRKLVPFLFPLKNGLITMPGVFIVVSDVSKAFDSVNQDKLLSVMEDVILQDEYTLEKFIQVICTKNSLKVHQHLSLAPGGIVAESAKITLRLPAHSLDCILVKKASSKKISSEEFNLILKEHIKRNVVQLDNNFYLQRVGIPQGSVLSTLLCSFYYGHMEKNVIFPFLEKTCKDISGENDTHGASTSKDYHAEEMLACTSKYILLRFIDDFLFISTSKKQALMFFSRLERGVREYNCFMNKEKYGLNFNINNTQGFQSNRLYVGKDGISHLRWSGLLINCHTLEIQADYTRYLNSRLSSTITVNCQGKVGRKLRAKLCDYLRPKCHPIFYDSNINSGAVVRLNIYQVFLLCAMKFLCYLSNLSTVPKFTPRFYINAINASLRYMHRLIKRKMYTFETDIAFRPKYDVKRKEILWLGLYAYSCVVKKKQSRYKKLFYILRYKLKAQGKVENISSELKYAVDDTHSSALWSIKY